MRSDSQSLQPPVKQPLQLSAKLPHWIFLSLNGLNTLTFWLERSRQRSKLRKLPDHILSDIGISRVDALREANKSFWKD